jgi:hypothetical protein
MDALEVGDYLLGRELVDAIREEAEKMRGK